MKKMHRKLTLTLLGLAIGSNAQAAAIISPFAADLANGSYSADLTYPGTSAQSAFNGGFWNSGTYNNHWIQADMGASNVLSQVTITAAVSPATQAQFWVYLSNTAIGNNYANLIPVATLTDHIGTSGAGPFFEEHVLIFAPSVGRFLQIVANGGASWTALGDLKPRADWIDPVSNVPLPPASFLMLSGLALVLKRRKQI
jgi:hypothetical protein